MSHTPGPWKVERRTNGAGLSWHIADDVSRESFPLAITVPCPPFAFGSLGALVVCDNAEDNAHLIAAAPDLLEAARAAKKYLEPDLREPGRTVFWNLVAAIEKASPHSKPEISNPDTKKGSEG